VLRSQGDLSGALSAYRQSLAIAEQLAGSDPSNAGWQRDLWVSYVKMARVSEESKPEDAQQWWRKAYETLAAMKAQGLFISPQDEQNLRSIKRKTSSPFMRLGTYAPLVILLTAVACLVTVSMTVSAWFWLLAAPMTLLLVGGVFVSILSVKGMFSRVRCPHCGGSAFLWRGNLTCPKCWRTDETV
jgi:hypothetical protein